MFMKLNRYIVILLLLSSIIFLFCGCGGGGSSESRDSREYEEPEVPQSHQVEPETPQTPSVPQTSQDTQMPLTPQTPERPQNLPETPAVDSPDVEERNIAAEYEDIILNPELIPLSAPVAVNYDSSIITSELLAQANSHYPVTADHHPRWTGMVFMGPEIFYYADNNGNMTDNLNNMKICKNFGFNAIRIMWPYRQLFNKDVTKVNVKLLKYLDRIIASAIEYDVHIEFSFLDWPGFWSYTAGPDYTPPYLEGEETEAFRSYGEFDLWVNTEKRTMVKNMLQLLAKRYKAVPSSVLSMYLIWESSNNSRASRLDVPEGVNTDSVGSSYREFVEAIRNVDPNRLVTIETGASTTIIDYGSDGESKGEDTIAAEETDRIIKTYLNDFDNIIYQYNYGCAGIILHGLNVPDDIVDKRYTNVDLTNTTSIVIEYPLTIYGINNVMDKDTAPIEITGFIPNGTVMNIDIINGWGANIVIKADDEVIHQELLPEDIDYAHETIYLSAVVPYFASEKVISVNIPDNTTKITILCDNDGACNLGGIKMTYPEEYAVNKWYYRTGFSAFTEGEEEGLFTQPVHSIMINNAYPNSGHVWSDVCSVRLSNDMTFTANEIKVNYNADTIMTHGERIINLGSNLIRYECGRCQSAEWNSLLRYYHDIYTMCEKYNISWYSHDWDLIIMNPQAEKSILNMPNLTRYDVIEKLNVALLSFMKEYLSNNK